MNEDSGKISAQTIDHESPKEQIGPNLEEKIRVETSQDGSHSESQHAATEPSTKQSDAEKAETEMQDPESIKVPRSQRRGLFGRFTVLAEVEEPKHYSRRTKWYITFVVALAAIAAPMGSAIIFRMAPDRFLAALLIKFQLLSNRLQTTYIPLQPSPTSRPRCICFPCPSFHCGGPHFPRLWDDERSILHHSPFFCYSMSSQRYRRTSPC